MMDNGTPVVIEDSSDGEKLQQHKDLLTDGGLSDNSNTSSSSQTVTDSVSLDSEDLKFKDSSVIVEDITKETEEPPKSLRKVNGEVQSYSVHKESDTDSEPDHTPSDKTTESDKTLCDKDSDSSKENLEHDDEVLDEDLKSDEKLNCKNSEFESKWYDKDTESDKNVCTSKADSEENLYNSDYELNKEVCNREIKTKKLVCDADAETKKLVEFKEPECVKSVCSVDAVIDTEPFDEEFDSNKVLETKYDHEEENCTALAEPDEKIHDKDSGSDEKVTVFESESKTNPSEENYSDRLKNKAPLAEKEVVDDGDDDDDDDNDDELSECGKKGSDKDSDSDKRLNDADIEKTTLTIADGIKTRARNNKEAKPVSTSNLQVPTLRKRKRKASPICKDLSEKDNASVDCNVEFKGFKKRMLAQISPAVNSLPLTSVTGNNFHASHELEGIAAPPSSLSYGADSSTRLTEYAQYLGLQPTVKFKCFKCGESGFPSMPALHEHQIICLKTAKSQSIPKYVVSTAQPPTTTATTLSSGTPSTNFRITRKVYLCSACGTYYENWNLFEHMRVVHKRLICLFCLGMFAQADKLSAHLCNIHRMTEKSFQSAEHFMNEFKGSSFLMCCSCEKLFEETNNFFDHHCEQSNANELCESCGVHGSCHLGSCKQKVVNKTLQPASMTATSVLTQTATNTAKELQDPSAPKKYLLSSKKKASATKDLKHSAPLLEAGSRKNRTHEKEFSDEDYDISDAASFCHVNIHEQPENQSEDDNRTKTHHVKKTGPIIEVNGDKRTNSAKSTRHQSDSDTESIKSSKDVFDEDLRKSNEEKRKSSFCKELVSSDSSRSCEFPEPNKDEHIKQKNTNMVENCVQGTTDAKNLNSQEQPVIDIQSSENGSETFTNKIKELNGVDSQNIKKVSETENSLYSLKLESIYEPPSTVELDTTIVCTQKSDEKIGSNVTDGLGAKLVKTENNRTNSQPEHPNENISSDQKTSILAKDDIASDENSNTRLSSDSVDTESKNFDEPVIKLPVLASKNVEYVENHAGTSDTHVKYNSSGSDNDSTQGSAAASSSTDVSSDESQHQDDFSKGKTKVRPHIESEDENVDSDKMSLVVDENGSDEEIDSRDDNENNGDKMVSEERLSSVETVKQDTESDFESKQDYSEDAQEVVTNQAKNEESHDIMRVADNDVPLLELTLDRDIDEMSCAELIKECVKVSSASCVYCNHAKKIAVNGKQLLLHVLAEHRFSIVVCSDSGELTEVNGFVSKLEKHVNDLQNVYFNSDTYDSTTKVLARSFDRIYECFHCHFVTAIHKELYLHNRKMHQKTILLCIMCKSNFYSYSELLCHICPGIYVSDCNISFRCCLCDVDGLPSAFRLLVHLRKRHNACDVCLESTDDQQKLSNHVWKHKLHHLCYRCGIAYRNKPDITKHLFWKHGTESVLCKRCLQKKWPHVYHFCIPPTTFVCEECSAHFSRAVALKVHKRLHAGDLPYSCEECDECFISKKLLAKHCRKHENISDKENNVEDTAISHVGDDQKIIDSDETTSQQDKCLKEGTSTDNELEVECVEKALGSVEKIENGELELKSDSCRGSETEQKEKIDKKSKVVDVYDLPPLNLSSDSDDSDDGADINKCKTANINNEKHDSDLESKVNNETCCSDENQQPPQVLDDIWDDFKTYTANLEKREGIAVSTDETVQPPTDVLHVVMLDHDYCGGVAETVVDTDVPGVSTDVENIECSSNIVAGVTDTTEEKTEDDKNRFDAEHNYCFSNEASPNENEAKDSALVPEESSIIPSKKKKTVKKKQKRSASSSSSDSSSSDSSSCSCGTNCSCSSSSSSSSGSSSSPSSDSDSSSSEGRRRQAARREKRKERGKSKKKVEDAAKAETKSDDPGVSARGYSPEVEEPLVKVGTTAEHDETEPVIRESDLETDETETDEDFYDKHPQKLANKLLAEKRNQLLLLAAVAPVNNGTIATTSPAVVVPQEMNATGKKMKTKKRRKSQYEQHPAIKKVKVDSLPKQNASTSFFNSQASAFSVSTPLPSVSNQAQQVTISTAATLPQIPYSPSIPHPAPTPSYHSTGSGSETDSKRLSRRRRVPKRFYGDTSDEDGDSTPQRKWQKASVSEISVPVSSAFSYRGGVNSVSEPKRTVVAPLPEKSDDEDVEDDSESEREMKRSNSDSSNSDSDKGNEQSDLDSDTDNLSVTQTQTTVKSGEDGQQKSDNLYCYCQCPYDEVSEMIACDGKGCAIEWFHFECVGIMVPPKGEWFCPDCRKKLTSRTEQMLHA